MIAIPLAFAFGQQLVTGVPGLGPLLPWALVVPIGESETSVTGAIMTGRQVDAPGAVVITAVACVVFVVVAFWKWRRTEP